MAKPKTAKKLMGTTQWAVPSRSGGRNTKTNDDRERRFTAGDGRTFNSREQITRMPMRIQRVISVLLMDVLYSSLGYNLCG
jgi:hypothetical protein